MSEESNSPTQSAGPSDLPTDPDSKLRYVIGDLLREKANALKLGDHDQLVELASWLVRAVEGGGIATLPHPATNQPNSQPAAKSLGPCLPCNTCTYNFTQCTGTYAKCKAAYDACVSCPCTA